MTKKKNPTTKKIAPVVLEQPIDPTPPEDVPTIQIAEEKTEQVQEPEPEKSAEVEQPAEQPVAKVEPQPVVEVVAEPTPAPVKPKPLTMTSLHADIEELRKIVDEQSILIKQLMEAPAKQRKPPLSNGKVQIKDTKTGKIYPSKNNVYQSLLKAGELKDLVAQGVFGAIPEKNSFGCYNLFRAYPGRFVEIKPEEIKA